MEARIDIAISYTITPTAEPEQLSEQLLRNEDDIISSLNAAHKQEINNLCIVHEQAMADVLY